MTQRPDHAEADVWRWQRWVACGLGSRGHSVGSVVTEVGRLGCVQAQEFDMTLWSMSQRTGCTRDQALAAVASQEVLRTHALRVTWHFLRAADLARIQTATADRVHRVLDPMLRARDFDEGTLTAWQTHVAGLLADGPLTRSEIAARLAGSRFAYEGMALGLALMWAELEQVIASGPPRGVTHTYALVRAEPAQPDPAQSIAWLVGQFLGSHGPSSISDVCAWSSLTRTAVRQALSDLGEVVHRRDVLGVERHWIGALPDDTWPDEPVVALLNGYDEYVSGLVAGSKVALDPDRLYRDRLGTPVALLMVDGILAGHWRRTRTAAQVRLEVTPLRELSADELTALEQEAQRYRAFVGLPVDLEVLAVR